MSFIPKWFKSTPIPPPFKPTEVKITVFYDEYENTNGDGFYPFIKDESESGSGSGSGSESGSESGKEQTALTFRSVKRPPSEFRRNSPTTYGWQHIKPDDEMGITGIDNGEKVLGKLNEHISDPKLKGTFILGHYDWQQLYPKESKMAGGKRKSRKRKSRKRKSRKRLI